MIGRLTGLVADCSPDALLIDVGGVGYRLSIALSTYYALAERRGGTATVHVHTHVREDALQLFGFLEIAEQRTFETLIAISGVGPRLALAVLSGIGVDELRVAVDENDRARLQKIPGVGKKTAERILLELRGRLDATVTGSAGAVRAGLGAESTGGGSTRLRADALSALANLGYTESQAERAVEGALSKDPAPETLEAVLKRALSGLS